MLSSLDHLDIRLAHPQRTGGAAQVKKLQFLTYHFQFSHLIIGIISGAASMTVAERVREGWSRQRRSLVQRPSYQLKVEVEVEVNVEEEGGERNLDGILGGRCKERNHARQTCFLITQTFS